MVLEQESAKSAEKFLIRLSEGKYGKIKRLI